jgi:hypothetical protein
MIQRIVQWANWKRGDDIFSTPLVAFARDLITGASGGAPEELLSITPAVVECYLVGERIYFDRNQAIAAEAIERQEEQRERDGEALRLCFGKARRRKK